MSYRERVIATILLSFVTVAAIAGLAMMARLACNDRIANLPKCEQEQT